MIARVDSFVLQGIEAIACEIEADLSPCGLPRATIVGLPDVAVRESLERVRAALVSSGFRFPRSRLTINLAPADVRKEGPVYDLPIAVAVLQGDGTIETGGDGRPTVGSYLVAGELALDGRLRFVRGGTSLGLLARQLGKQGVIVPRESAAEAGVVDGIDVIGVSTLGEVVAFLNGSLSVEPHPPVDAESMGGDVTVAVDFADIRGQEAAKRALTIAAAGDHNVLMMGPAGTGKTMMAKALPGVLPPLTRDEALEVTRIYSSVGRVPRDRPLMLSRPVRMPHHTASGAAIVGGGRIPRPGDVTLAHHGVLFLDELPEFSRAVLETLRQPLEDGCVTIARARGSVQFPARFMLVAALNPTARGDRGPRDALRPDMERYLRKISGPLIDRIDLHVEVPAVPYRELSGPRRGTDSGTIRTRVLAARSRQRERQGRIPNARLPGGRLDDMLDEGARGLLVQAMTELGLSARAHDKIRRVACTIADLEAETVVAAHHVAEAVQYRLLDRDHYR